MVSAGSLGILPVMVFALLVVGPAVLACVSGTQGRREELVVEQELSDRLEVVNRDMQRRIIVKELLVAELIAGRTTLAIVADEFLVLGRTEYLIILRGYYPGASDQERAARNVIGYVTATLGPNPTAKQAEALTRLRGEFQDLHRSQTAGTRDSDAFQSTAKPHLHFSE